MVGRSGQHLPALGMTVQRNEPAAVPRCHGLHRSSAFSSLLPQLPVLREQVLHQHLSPHGRAVAPDLGIESRARGLVWQLIQWGKMALRG